MRALLQRGKLRCCQWSAWQLNFSNLETRTVDLGRPVLLWRAVRYFLNSFFHSPWCHWLPSHIFSPWSGLWKASAALLTRHSMLHLLWRACQRGGIWTAAQGIQGGKLPQMGCPTCAAAESRTLQKVRSNEAGKGLWIHDNLRLRCKGLALYLILLPFETNRLSSASLLCGWFLLN